MPPFEESLKAISELAMLETGATGYTVFERQEIVDARGIPIPQTALRESEEIAVLCYGLCPRGKADRHIAFAFPDRLTLEAARPRLARVAEILNAVWGASVLEDEYVCIAQRLADLDARLLDAKIAERARGFIEDRSRPDPIEDIARHVSSVLRPTSARQTITQLLAHLRKEVEARLVASQAKALLQNAHGMSEDAAHRYLQRLSRKTRRPMHDIANAVVAKFAAPRS